MKNLYLRRLAAISTLLVIGLTMASCSYAELAQVLDSDNIVNRIQSPAGVISLEHSTLEFIEASCTDNEPDLAEPKDVAECHSQLVDINGNGIKEQIEITINNAYPGYEAYLNFTMKNIGDQSDYVEDVSTSSSDEISVTINDLVNTEVKPEETLTGTVTIRILHSAETNQDYFFSINIDIGDGTG